MVAKLFLFRLFGQRPRRGRSPVEHRGTFICPFVRPCALPLKALSGLKSALSGLESALSGLKFVLSDLLPILSGLKSALPGLKSALSDSWPERADFRPERADFRPQRAWGDGWTDGWTNESPPVFYRTLSPSGPLPCLSFRFTTMQSMATGIADHVLPLGDLFF